MQEALLNLVEQTDSKKYGKYRGFVTDNKDPEQRGRLRLTIPSVLENQQTDWALPCFPFGGHSEQGFFMVPTVGSQVWVEFEEGDINCPIWTGTFWQQKSDVPAEAAKEEPTTFMIKTPAGQRLQFDDQQAEESIRLYHKSKAELVIDKQGGITLNDARNNTLILDAETDQITLQDSNGNRLIMGSQGTMIEDVNGTRIEMDASGVTVDSTRVVVRAGQVSLGGEGGEPLIKGQSFLSLFAMHRHTVAPIVGGPTSPPIPQGELSTLSSKVTTT